MESVKKPYTVEMIDRSGSGPTWDFPTLEEAADHADALMTKYGTVHYVTRVYNSDNIDLDWNDGLEEEEREYLSERGLW